MIRLFHLHTKSSCEDDRKWLQEFRRSYECPDCGALNREIRNRPIDVRLSHKPDRSALNSSSRLIGIIRTDFMGLFEPDFSRSFLVGRVLDRRGDPIEGFATFISQEPIALRGGPKSHRRYCDRCGRFIYSWIDDDEVEPYVMRDDLTSQKLYGAGGSRLLMVEAFVNRIDRKKWKGFWIQEIPVRDTPLDGIESFPENYY